MANKRKPVSVIGPNSSACTPEIYAFGVELGARLVEIGCPIVCGGMGGLMEAVCKGARESEAYFYGATIGIIPGLNKAEANKYCDIVIPTGIGIARNQLVVNSGELVIAVSGGAGTLSEIAFAWQFGKSVICIAGFGGWSEQMGGKDLDNRKSGLLHRAGSLDEVIQLASDILDNTP